MMKENWTDQMRRKLEGHEVTPPEGLWEDICKEMGLTPEPVRKPAASKRWYWAAAALLALAGFFAYYHDDGLRVKNEELRTKSYDYSQDENNPKQGNHNSLLFTLHSSLSSESPVLTAENQNDTSAVHQETETSQPLEIPSHPSEQSPGIASQPDEPLPEVLRHQSEKQGKWSVGLNALGGLLAATSVQTDRVYFDRPMSVGFDNKNAWAEYNFSGDGSAIPYYTYTEYVWKHRLPVRFGLKVQYQLNNRLALFSGFNYTYLYSECSIPLYNNMHYSQRLHYLGAPLGITWQLWSSDHFRFYFSGSGMLEKCISSKYSNLDSQTVDGKKPWQWSVQAAAGAEYLFTPQFGAYLEPSLGYYFDDGTSLQHYYKEHPLAPSIEFGLRLHLR